MPTARNYGPRIPAPNYKQIHETAERQALESLGLERIEDAVAVRPDGVFVKATAIPDELLVKAAAIIEQADAEIALHLGERDQALAHLWFYEQRLGLSRTTGLSAMGFRQALATVMFGHKTHMHDLPTGTNEEIVQAAEAAGIERIDNAEDQLLKSAAVIHAARARREIAMFAQEEATLTLSEKPLNWKPSQIAELAGVARHVVYQHRDRARARRL